MEIKFCANVLYASMAVTTWTINTGITKGGQMYKFRPSHKIPKLSRHPVHKRVINYTGHSQSQSQQHPRINDNNNNEYIFQNYWSTNKFGDTNVPPPAPVQCSDGKDNNSCILRCQLWSCCWCSCVCGGRIDDLYFNSSEWLSRPLIFVSRIFISTQTESPLLYLSLLLLFCIVPSKSFPWLTTIPQGRDLPFWFIHSRHNGNEQRIIFCSFPTILHKEFHVDKQSRPLIIFMIQRTKPGHTRFSSGIPFGTACPRVLYVIDWQHQ